MKYSFEIKAKAVGKERPRYSAITKKMYTPTKTSTFEATVRYAFLNKYNINTELSKNPFRARILAFFEPPKSISKKKKSELIYTPYTKKPDVDNIVKSILDSLNGIAYKDDNQVIELIILKRYGLENKIIVELEEIN